MQLVSKWTALLLITSAAVVSAPAYAQGQGSGGQRGEPRGESSMSAEQDRQMDRMQDQMPDRDRLFLGARDRIGKHDADQNGKINREEFDNWRRATFDTMDADGNGLLKEEYLATRLGPGPYGPGNTAHQQEMQERANLRKSERYRVMDGNGDGVVTREEFTKFGELNYLEAGADDDGQLTFKELQQYNRGM